ncbi:MAG: transposase [Myxococcales bacterium]|nr:transposase [Myxococcales bacterium]
MLGINIALGTVSKIEARATDALAVAHRERWRIRSAPYVNMDGRGGSSETRKRGSGSPARPRSRTTRSESDRSSEVVIDILGEDFTGIVGNDRARAYLALEPVQRQVCWFHLGREYQSKIGSVARPRASVSRCGRSSASSSRLIISGVQTTSRTKSFQRRMKMLRGEVLTALYAWQDHDVDSVGGMCRNLLGLEPAMWTFVKHPNVEAHQQRRRAGHAPPRYLAPFVLRDR